MASFTLGSRFLFFKISSRLEKWKRLFSNFLSWIWYSISIRNYSLKLISEEACFWDPTSVRHSDDFNCLLIIKESFCLTLCMDLHQNDKFGIKHTFYNKLLVLFITIFWNRTVFDQNGATSPWVPYTKWVIIPIWNDCFFVSGIVKLNQIEGALTIKANRHWIIFFSPPIENWV